MFFRGIELDLRVTLNYRFQASIQVVCLGYCPHNVSDIGLYMECNAAEMLTDVREHMYRWHGDLSDAQSEPGGPVYLLKGDND